MEIYSTEEQQVEAIKTFWKEYGMSIIGGAVLGLGGLFGWNAYQDHQETQRESASTDFAKIVESSASADEVRAAADAFRAEHGNAGYLALTDLLEARTAVESGDLARAESLLSGAIGQLDSSVAPLAQLRLARVQIAQDNLAAAEATLATISNEAFVVQRDELKGDLFKQKGELQAAREAYQSALDAGGALTNPGLQMKLDDLAQAG
ncbi:YfgM family protein [Ferrimonas marina]|uniref:Putative negative regulator of RcsB-dependent stress response n=1 Tax=Ferrimonas marina TaxID=299255 RepID=A0A1M5S3T0_9GAMM|nr:tetratricopeptide repeat protein [Ferrimonas marina]SHH33151.1 Putative negative regulator of RcsB-dependent stress response [Ferrimonas marina]